MLPGVLIMLLVAGIYYQGRQTRRVFATGSTYFWLNVFSDQPQLSGAADQAVVNPMLPDIWFGIPFSRGSGGQSAVWLHAYGIGAVVTGGKRRSTSLDVGRKRRWPRPGRSAG